MGPVSISGGVSGLDWQSIVDQLMAIEQKPVNDLQAKEATWRSDESIWTDLGTKLGDLDAAIQNLQSASTWNALAFTSSNTSVVTGSAGSGAVPGTYQINVTQLAQAEKDASDAQSSTTTPLGLQGSFSINGVQVQVASTDTLTDIAAHITATSAQSNVQATVVGSQLVITALNTNAAISYSDVSGGILQTLGVLTSTGTVKNQLLAPQPAKFTVDNTISVTSDTNTSTAIAGVTLNLVSMGTATVTVSQDTQKIVQAVQDFVNKYNTAWSAITSNLAKGAALQGDSTLMQLQVKLRQLVSTMVSGLPADYNNLSDIGVSTSGKDGTLSLDTAKLASAIAANPGAVQNLFASTQSGVTPLGVQFNNLLTMYTDPATGIIKTVNDSLNAQIQDADNQIAQLQSFLAMRKAALQQQFIAMESMITMLNGQMSALGQMPVPTGLGVSSQ